MLITDVYNKLAYTFLVRYYFQKSSIKIVKKENLGQGNNNNYLLIVYQYNFEK
jgi:hypothetical protein